MVRIVPRSIVCQYGMVFSALRLCSEILGEELESVFESPLLWTITLGSDLTSRYHNGRREPMLIPHMIMK